MGGVKRMWFCGYRDWALQIYDKVTKSLQVDIPLITSPEKFNLYETGFAPGDIIFFIGWSWILPKEVVERYHCICLHPSPLPKYRGGSPLQHQIINGESESAVTFFVMDEYVDRGPVLYSSPFSLEGSLTDIFERIVRVGTHGLIEIVEKNLNGADLIGTPQDESGKTYFRRRTPDMSEIKLEDFRNCSAQELYNKVRALEDPYPNAYVVCENGTKLYLKVVGLADTN